MCIFMYKGLRNPAVSEKNHSVTLGVAENQGLVGLHPLKKTICYSNMLEEGLFCVDVGYLFDCKRGDSYCHIEKRVTINGWS